MNKKRIMRILLWCAFVFYCLVLVGILFLGGRVHRYPGQSFWDYIRFSVNPIPFKTICDYIFRVMEGRINADLAIRNIGGNLVLFLPMGIFLPCLFVWAQSFRKVMLSVFGMISCVEILQLVLRLGIFDIDDFILNMLGCAVGFLIWNIPPVNRFLKKLFAASCEATGV